MADHVSIEFDSPAGQAVAFSSPSTPARHCYGPLALVDAESERRRLLVNDTVLAFFWSPDGRSLGFFATGKLKRVDIQGSSPIVLADAADVDTTTTGGSWRWREGLHPRAPLLHRGSRRWHVGA